jgi:hypothetical protein
MDEESLDLLMEQTLDVLVVAGWLVRISVAKKTEGDNNDMMMTSKSDSTRLPFLMALDATVQDVKLVVMSHYGIVPKEQRFFDLRTGKPVFYGPLVPSIIANPQIGEVRFEMKTHYLDPRLESLFEMVHMKNDADRDELMYMMTQSRKAGECRCGQILVPSSMEINNSAITCKMCHFEASMMQNTHVCHQCQYALCSICYNKDTGQTVCQDPDQALVQMAEELGARFAGPASWFGGPGRSYGLPSINFPSEIVPRRYRHSSYANKVKIDRTTQVLHKGVNVKIVFDDDVRRILTEAGEEWKSLELNMDLPEGATVYDIMRFRSLLMRSPMWPVVEKRLLQKAYRESVGRQKPCNTILNTIMKLCTFSTQEAVFSISAVAHVDHY